MDSPQPNPIDVGDVTPAGRIDFLGRDWENRLRSFDAATQSLEDIYELLTVYSHVLRRDVSLAVARGTILTGTEISNRLGNCFSTSSPTVIEGAPVTWVELVLSLGPEPTFTQLASIQNRIRLASMDQDLLRSGRPWRFLWPWPGNEDWHQEWQVLQVIQEELTSVDRTARQVCEFTPKLREQIEHRQALVRPLVVHPDPCGIRSPQPPDAAAPSVYETRVLSPSPGPTENEHESKTTAATSITSSARAPLSSARSSPARSSSAPLSTASSHDERSSSLHSVRSNRPPQKRKHRRNTRTKSFIDNLYSALDDPTHAKALSWSSDGKSFVAHEGLFSSALLEQLETSSYKRFIRRLYYFGFRKFHGTFQHHLFVRGQPCPILPRSSPRRKPGSPTRKSTLRSHDEKNFQDGSGPTLLRAHS